MPFDRHDWVVDRCGNEIRYVIDYYEGNHGEEEAFFHLDVRPGVDGMSQLLDRFKMALRRQ